MAATSERDSPGRVLSDSPFCKTLPTLQHSWDNTSLALLKECPRKYQYAIIEGWRPKITAAPLLFGGVFHSAMELFDRLRHEGEEYSLALRAAVKLAMKQTVWEEEIKDEEGNVSRVLHFWSPDDPNRSRALLVRAVVWYCEHYQSDMLETYTLPDGTPALEVSFRFDLPINSPDGDPYLYVGHIDKIARLGAQIFNVERKHTKYTLNQNYFAKYTPNAQVSGYSFAGKVVLSEPVSGTIVDGTQIGVEFNRFARSLQGRNPEALEEWHENTLFWIKLAEFYARQDYWPMNEESCHKYSGCQFRDVCSKSPQSRQAWLESRFKRDAWNPLDVRGGDE